MKVAAGMVLILLQALPLSAQTPAIEITLAHDSEGERAVRAQLQRLLERYDVSKWIFTKKMVIDETQIPHSHPVLTIHTRHRGDDVHLLSTFVHEQFHWFVTSRRDHEAAATAEFRAKYPHAPVGAPDGGNTEPGTYLHLIVCDMEFQAMTSLLGESAARAAMREWTHYRWIYAKVLDDPAVREINTRHGFVPPR